MTRWVRNDVFASPLHVGWFPLAAMELDIEIGRDVLQGDQLHCSKKIPIRSLHWQRE
jgi:hypothetical protein